MEPAGFNRYTGTYYSDEEDVELRIYVDSDRLVASVDNEAPVELTFLSDTRFLVPGEAAAHEFVFVNGHAARVRTMESAPIVLERVE